MGHAQRRKKNTGKNKFIGRDRKTKHYQRDIDQIVEDLDEKNILKFQNLPIDEDKPGLGQFYCIFCAKYFQNKKILDDHKKSKEHKKRVKATKEKPYTIEDSKLYAGKTKQN